MKNLDGKKERSGLLVHLQGQKERDIGIPVSPLCAGNVDVPKAQLTFLVRLPAAAL